MSAPASIRIAERRPFTLTEAVRQVGLRWYLVLAIIAAGAVATLLVGRRVRPAFSSTATVRLLPATLRPQLETGVQLPREELPDPETLANTLQEMVLAPESLTSFMASRPALFDRPSRESDEFLRWLRSRARVQSKSAEVYAVEAWGRSAEQARELARWMALGTMDAYKKTLRDRADTLARFTRQQAEQAARELTTHEETMVAFLRRNPGLLVSAMDRDRRLSATGPDRMRVQAMLRRAGSSLGAKDPAVRALMEERERLQAELRSLQGGDAAPSAGSAKLRELQAAQRRLEELRSEGRSDADPAVKLARQQVERIQEELERVRPGEGGTGQLQSRASARLKEIDARLRKALKQPQSSPRLEAQWGEMLRQQGLLVKRYEGFNRLASTAAFDNGLGVFENKALASLIADASQPRAPRGIRPGVVLAVGLMLSCLLGVALALAVGRTDGRIYRSAELRELLGLPLLAEIERQPPAAVLRGGETERVQTNALIAWSKDEEVVEVGLKLLEPGEAAGQIGDGEHLGRLALPAHQETALSTPGTSALLDPLAVDDRTASFCIRTVVASPPLAPGLFLSTAPRSRGADQVRLLASRLSEIGGKRIHVLLIASWEPRVGRTTVAANVAMALAEARRRVLLVDTCGGDASLTRLMGLRPEPDTGLYEQLSARMAGTTGSWTVYRLAESLSMVPASSNRTPMGPMLSAVAFGDFIEHCRGVFDVVVLDSRPLSQVSDVVILHQRADAVIAVVRRRISTLRGLQQMARQLDQRRWLGSVFTEH